MDRALTDLGLDGTSLEIVAKGSRAKSVLEEKKLRSVVEALGRLEDAGKILRHRGVPFREILKYYLSNGRMPRYWVRTGKGGKCVAGSRQLAATVKGEGDDEIENAVVEIHDGKDIERDLKSLKNFGLDLKKFFDKRGHRKKTRPSYILTSNGETAEIDGIREILPVLRRLGQKGVDVQRYKGLGEMNAEQLRVTTMAPASRTLMQIKVEDAVKADRMFTMLMGDQVAPRREFIEHNALDVRMLDV
ncbi:MAG: hypothetical protein J7M19_05350 [Planctomycetes bacterium]|nr:hypothetical protein [Planctomycetota bacterium]